MAEESGPKEKPGNEAKPRRDRTLTFLMAAAILVAVGGFGWLLTAWLRHSQLDAAGRLRVALEQFVLGDRIVASHLAEGVELDPEMAAYAEWSSVKSFLLGAGHVAKAEEETAAAARRRHYFNAIPDLEASAKLGFPPGRTAEGQRLLGISLHGVGRFPEAISALDAAIAEDQTLERSLLPLRAEAELHAEINGADEAYRTIERMLSETSLDAGQRRKGELIRIEALIRLQRRAEASQLIAAAMERLAPAGLTGTSLEDRAENAAFRDRLRLLKAELTVREVTSRFGERPSGPGENRAAVAAALRETLSELNDLQREASPLIAARSRLWTAAALLSEGEVDLAVAQLALVRQQRPFGAEGIAGGLREIELLAERGQGPEAVQATRYMVRELGDPRTYDGSIVSFPEFKRRLLAALEKLRRVGQFDAAIDLARALPPVFGPTEALLQEGIGYREWAEETIAEGTGAGRDTSPDVARLARGRYRAAGDAFADAAELAFTTEAYLPSLWSAIEAYQNGGHFKRSLDLLEPYLRYEERQRKPRALIAKGRALLADPDRERSRDAIDAFQECIVEYPRDPLRYDARLNAAQAFVELDQLEDAQRLLEENLKDGELGPSSPAWKASLFSLGNLLFRRVYENQLRVDHAVPVEKERLQQENRAVFPDAIRRLNEAVDRYWPDPAALHACYLAARTHRMAAEAQNLDAGTQEVTAYQLRASRQSMMNELQAALDRFNRLRQYLDGQLDENGNDESRLPAQHIALLRNSMIGTAETLYAMDRFDEAGEAYQSITARYMNKPLALEGILGHARCLRRLGRSVEADGRIRQAQLVLRRIPDEWTPRFDQITRYSRDEWERLLTWMNDRIDPPETS